MHISVRPLCPSGRRNVGTRRAYHLACTDGTTASVKAFRGRCDRGPRPARWCPARRRRARGRCVGAVRRPRRAAAVSSGPSPVARGRCSTPRRARGRGRPRRRVQSGHPHPAPSRMASARSVGRERQDPDRGVDATSVGCGPARRSGRTRALRAGVDRLSLPRRRGPRGSTSRLPSTPCANLRSADGGGVQRGPGDRGRGRRRDPAVRRVLRARQRCDPRHDQAGEAGGSPWARARTGTCRRSPPTTPPPRWWRHCRRRLGSTTSGTTNRSPAGTSSPRLAGALGVRPPFIAPAGLAKLGGPKASVLCPVTTRLQPGLRGTPPAGGRCTQRARGLAVRGECRS